MKLSAYIEITQCCNLHCKHCYNASGDSYETMSFDSFKQIVDQLQTAFVISISGGEPLVHPDIKKMLLYVCQHSSAEIRLITNGLLIDEAMIDWMNRWLAEYNFTIQISVDGGTQESYDSIRGYGNYKKLLYVIRNILSKSNIPIYFHVTLYHGNIESLEKIIRLAIENNHKFIDFAYVKSIGRAKNNRELLLSRDDLIQLDNSFHILSKKYNNYIRINHPKEFFGICPFYINDISSLSIRIDPTGNVFPCQIMTSSKFIIGNIYENELIDITAPDRISRISESIAQIKKGRCENCIASPICYRGCPATEVFFDDTDEQSIECVSRILKLKDQINYLSKRKDV